MNLRMMGFPFLIWKSEVEEAFYEWKVESYPSNVVMVDEETDGVILAHMRSIAVNNG